MKLLLIAFGIFLNTNLISPLFAQQIEELEMYEIRNYDPQKVGVTDLVFEARIEKLTEILNKAGNFGKLTDVYFKIYWLSPSKYTIEVMGLPKGFKEVRDDLMTLIKGKLEFVIPEKFSNKLKGYSLTSANSAEGKLIRATDPTFTMSMPELNITFDRNGRLKRVDTNAGYSTSTTEFFQSPKAWSQNKLVIDKIVTVTKANAMTNTVTNEVDFTSINGVGFPSRVKVKNVTEVKIPATEKEKARVEKAETGSVINFSKYEVNTGKAGRFMTEGLRR